MRLTGVEVRDPMMDRRLIELCLSIPEENYLDLHIGETRAIARGVLKDLVPMSILAERRRGLQSADWPDRLNEARPDIEAEVHWMQKSPLAQELLDVPRVVKLMEDMSSGEYDNQERRAIFLGTLCNALGASRFLRQFERDNSEY